VFALASETGCRSPASHRGVTDRAVSRLIREAQQEAVGRTEPVVIASPADTLRRRLLLDKLLPYASPASLGVRDLPVTATWRPGKHLDAPVPADTNAVLTAQGPVTLVQALQIGAANSREFQSAKEELYSVALDLDLEADAFRSTFSGMLSGSYSRNAGGEDTVTFTQGGSSLGVQHAFRNGIELSGSIMVDLVKLLTQETASSLGLLADAGVTIPLLRGAGRDIVSEPLRQAEQNLLYAVYTFERFKRTFAVRVASLYLSVLREHQQIENAKQNYDRLVLSARRARRLADAGRLPEFQFDQAVQDELRARSRWVDARQRYAASLDAFKVQLGLPPDVDMVLDTAELGRLDYGSKPTWGMDMEPERAIRLALGARLDLRTAEGRVRDAQHKVHVAADALRAELTLLGSAQAGARRNSAPSASEPDARLRPDKGVFSGILNLDLPFERTVERTGYRKSLIVLESAVRNLQKTEDEIKLSVLDDIRALRQADENVQIQLEAVRLAEKRVHSTDLLLQAGRAAVRDVLESQEALLNAQNALVAARVSCRVSELALQRDMGLLQVRVDGLWAEYRPEED
jgi:outer membrane protein TolC